MCIKKKRFVLQFAYSSAAYSKISIKICNMHVKFHPQFIASWTCVIGSPLSQNKYLAPNSLIFAFIPAGIFLSKHVWIMRMLFRDRHKFKHATNDKSPPTWSANVLFWNVVGYSATTDGEFQLGFPWKRTRIYLQIKSFKTNMFENT